MRDRIGLIVVDAILFVQTLLSISCATDVAVVHPYNFDVSPLGDCL